VHSLSAAAISIDRRPPSHPDWRATGDSQITRVL